MRYLYYFIYHHKQTYWHTTVTEPGWSSRQEETLFRSSNIHVPDDGILSVFHSVIDTTHMVLLLFVSYIRKKYFVVSSDFPNEHNAFGIKLARYRSLYNALHQFLNLLCYFLDICWNTKFNLSRLKIYFVIKY